MVWCHDELFSFYFLSSRFVLCNCLTFVIWKRPAACNLPKLSTNSPQKLKVGRVGYNSQFLKCNRPLSYCFRCLFSPAPKYNKHMIPPLTSAVPLHVLNNASPSHVSFSTQQHCLFCFLFIRFVITVIVFSFSLGLRYNFNPNGKFKCSFLSYFLVSKAREHLRVTFQNLWLFFSLLHTLLICENYSFSTSFSIPWIGCGNQN